MITVHHLNNSRSQRVLWLLEELGVSYDVMRHGGRIGGDRGVRGGQVRRRSLDSARGHAGAFALYFLVALRGRFGHAAAAAQVDLRPVARTPMPWPFSAMARRIAASVQRAFIGPQLKRHLDFMESELAAPSTIHIDS
jgi:glutathione S-transferase